MDGVRNKELSVTLVDVTDLHHPKFAGYNPNLMIYAASTHKVGFERLVEILPDKRYGKLYDPTHGGGLWVGKAYGKSAAWRRDPLKGLSHAASAMQAARFYYGIMTGTIIDWRDGYLIASDGFR